MVKIHPPVPFEKYLSTLASSHALLLIEFTFKEGILLLSKVGDYARSGKPVLFFSPKIGITSDLVCGLAHPGFLTQEEETVKQRLRDFFRRLERGDALDDYRMPGPDYFSPERVASDFLAAVGKVLNK